MKNVSIEYAHIYTNNKINEEHETSVQILTELKNELDASGQTMSLVVMVDDYSFPDPTFDYGEFTNWLAGKGLKPDLVIRESQLIPLCDQVISLIEKSKLKEQITEYIRNKKYPCSLFIATWYLLRLGHLNFDAFNKDLAAEKLINILPQSFKPFEDQGLDIISSTKFAESKSKIEYKFFEGRLIA
jgi:hypothetical protein